MPFVVNRETKNLWGFAVSENPGLPTFGLERNLFHIHSSRIHGQGFGEALLDFALAELKETECAGIYLLVFKENYSARHFYEKYGFIFTEEFSSCSLDETAVPEIKHVYKKQEDSGK